MIFHRTTTNLVFFITLLSLIEQADLSTCRLSREYEVYSVNKEGYKKFKNCLPCPHCPLGKGLAPDCGSQIRNNSTIMCKPCIQGKTYSDEIGIGSCKPCDDCRNRFLLKKCTLKSKQICAKTLCQQGYYFHGITGNCRRCSPCCVEKHDLKYNVRPQECADMPDNRNCKVTHHACSHKTTRSTTSTLATKTITGVPSNGTLITGSQATQGSSTVRLNVGASTMHIGTSTAKTTRKALSSAYTGIGLALSLVVLVILIGVFLLRWYMRKRKVSFSTVKERQLLSNQEREEMTPLDCEEKWEYKLCRIPLDMKEKIGLMLDNAPPGTGNAVKIAQHYGMSEWSLKDLSRRFQCGTKVGTEVLEFLAAKKPRLTLRQFCTTLTSENVSRRDVAIELCHYFNHNFNGEI